MPVLLSSYMCNMKSEIFEVSEVLFTLRMFVCNNKSRHHLPKRVWQSLWRLDSPGFHTIVNQMFVIPTSSYCHS